MRLRCCCCWRQSVVTHFRRQGEDHELSVPSGEAQNYSITIRTYLGSAQQESKNVEGSANGVGGGHGSSFDGYPTSKQFDAVEVLVVDNQASGTSDFHVYEICADH